MPYKKITFFVVIVILLLTINDLTNSIYATWQKQELIDKAQKNLEQEQKENQQLKKELVRVNQSHFIESEARDKLFLTKPGENIVVIPQNKLTASPAAKSLPPDMRPNWQRWWDLFFKA